VAAPTEKDAETMPIQKVFKQRVRARMTKTGESYTAARRQLLLKAADTEPGPPPEETTATTPTATPTASAAEDQGLVPAPASVPIDAPLVADAAMIRATGKGHAEWFAILDAWGATDHTHTEIARWLSETQGTPGWWVQNITVSYERARGMRARHQMANGFSISVTRTVDVGPDVVLTAFTDAAVRATWLPWPMRQRPTRARNVARFDWDEPPSRVVVSWTPKGDSRTTVTVGHEQLPDADAGEQYKDHWREWLGALKAVLERR
jgi:uncharacterized protein YndB with AHSA1/START domain